MVNFTEILTFFSASSVGSVFIACVIWSKTKELRKAARVALVIAGIIGLLYASVKDWGDLYNTLTGGGGSPVQNGGGMGKILSGEIPEGDPEIPAWYSQFPVPLSTNGFSWTKIPLDWKKWTFSDLLADDIFLDRDGDGLPDWLEFILGLDPRGTTSGGIIDDKFLLENGLDPFQIWDDEISPYFMT